MENLSLFQNFLKVSQLIEDIWAKLRKVRNMHLYGVRGRSPPEASEFIKS